MNKLLQAFLENILSKIDFVMEDGQVPDYAGLCGARACYDLAVQPEVIRKLVVKTLADKCFNVSPTVSLEYILYSDAPGFRSWGW